MALKISECLELDITGNFASGNNSISETSIEFYQLAHGLSVQLSTFKPRVAFKVNRLGTDNENLMILDFHINGEANLEVSNDNKDLPNGLIHGAYFASADVKSYATFPSRYINQQIHIIFDVDWIKRFFGAEIEPILDKIQKSKSFFIFERLHNDLIKLLLTVLRSNPNSAFRSQFLHGKVVAMLTLFFRQLRDRGNYLELGISSYSNVSKVFELMSYVENYPGENHSVAALSERIGFSESKLQKVFRAVYGRSVSKEVTERKMILALGLLSKNKMTVAAIANFLGYSNKSHFSRSFFKVHGFLPSSLKSKLIND